jgi:hypothetical protein
MSENPAEKAAQDLGDLVARLMNHLGLVNSMLKEGTTFGELKPNLEALWSATHDLLGSWTPDHVGLQVNTEKFVVPDTIPEGWS